MSISTVHAPSVRATLTVEVDDLDLDQRQMLAEEIGKAIHRVLHPDDEQVVQGWTRTTLQAALDRLDRSGARVQADVVREALKHQGYVTRDSVYKIGRYAPNRMLRGFTRPTNRVVSQMKAAGEIPSDAANLLEASYQNGVSADGFQVPSGLADLL